MDTARWPQEIVMKPLEEIVVVPSSNNNNNSNQQLVSNSSSSLERKLERPQKEEALNCPRCNSTNTKFCYYNNYSLSQPRYFCKGCKRYWTQGGSLRNIPIGGASRTKNKRSSSAAASKKLPDLVLTNSFDATTHNIHHQNPKIHQAGGGQDLNLGFPTHDLKTISQLIQVPNFDSPSSSAMELLNGMSSSSRGYLMMNSFMPMPVSDPSTMYSSGFSLQDLKPNLNFTLDHTGNIGVNHHQSGEGGYGDVHDHNDEQEALENTKNNNSNGCGKLLFPFEDLKQQLSGGGGGGTCNNNNSMDHHHQQQNRDHQQQQEQGDSNGYWSGVLGSGSW